jgi:DUF4097 and DUF4098 domain-containing protein YvlB
VAQKTRGVAHINHTTKSIPLPAVESVVVELDLTDSDLELSGGVGSLMEADFYYDEREQELPTVNYNEHDGKGKLMVQDVPARRRRYRNDVTENRWVIQLSESLPLDLRVGSASGDCVMDSDDTTLTHLYVATSSGDLDIGLSSTQPQLEDADVVSSSGDIRFDAGGEFPAMQKLSYRSSSGDVKLNLGGTFPALHKIDVNHTSGDLKAKLNGTFQEALALNVRNTSGDIYLDLRGTWQADLYAVLKMNSGDVTIQLPKDVGINVQASTTSGNVRSNGLSRKNGGWVNPSFGNAEINLTINITSLSGDIRLQLAD